MPAPLDVTMDIAALKNYLKAIRSAGVAVAQLDDLVNAAVDAGFAQVWGAYSWKVRRKDDTTLTCTSGQSYTVLPDDMESIDSIVIIDGASSWWINLNSEGNFEIDSPNPSALSSVKPSVGKVVFHSSQQNNRWRVYWNRIPDAAYSLRVIYQRVGTIGLLPQLPSYMTAAVVDRCLEYVLPPGEGRLAQLQAAEASLHKAIQADETVSGPPQFVGVDPGWNDDAFTGGGNDGDYLEGRPWLI